MNNSMVLKMAIAILFIIVVVAHFYLNNQQKAEDVITTINTTCNLNDGPCSVSLDSREIVIKTTGEIRPLKKFLLVLHAGDMKITSATVSLSMIGMDMGNNIFDFSKTDAGEWHSDIIIPVCTTGRRDWKVEIQINDISGKIKLVSNLKV